MLATLVPEALRLPLAGCGYRPELLRSDFAFGTGQSAPLVAFAQAPADSRSACIAVTQSTSSSRDAVSDCKQLGAPIVLVCSGTSLQWWKQGVQSPEFLESITGDQVQRFFELKKDEFAPEAIYRAKTWGRFKSEYQLSFVDLGLLPLVEAQVGSSLESLIGNNVAMLKADLQLADVSPETGHWLLQTIFWLLSGKILRDKQVPGFTDLDVRNVGDVFTRLAGHYGTLALPVRTKREREGLQHAADAISRFSSLALTTTESLAYVYENALISKETRTQLGTHSTPSFLVDYVVGNLKDWIEEIPIQDRSVFEPACGHAAFLVSAMRLLTELLPEDRATPRKRGPYLRSRLHGADIDAFALELARLSLTLTDIPNPNGWDLQLGDMFRPNSLEEQAKKSTILLANPPFDNFSVQEQKTYAEAETELTYVNKSSEMLSRTLPYLKQGAVFGVVLPQSFLQSKNSSKLREMMLRSFDLREICLFPDQVFSFSDVESAVLLGRRKAEAQDSLIRYRRIRERGLPQFRSCYEAPNSALVPQSRFVTTAHHTFRLPDLDAIWQELKSNPQLGDIVSAGRGFEFHGAALPAGQKTFSARPFTDAVPGFVRFDSGLHLHELPKLYWLNLDSSVVRRPVSGTLTGVEQVLLNYAPASRGPWRLKALLDLEGHAVSSRFIAVRPNLAAWSVMALWGLLNSPVANAFVFSHLGKRDNTVGEIRQMPVPKQQALGRLETSAKRYLLAAARQSDGIDLKELLLDVDCEVLRLYDLPAALERGLLDIFSTWDRVGVPFSQPGYIPEAFNADVSLSAYRELAKNWESTNEERGALIDRSIRGELDTEGRARLSLLQAYAEFHVFDVAPRPRRDIEVLENELLSLAEAEGRIVQ